MTADDDFKSKSRCWFGSLKGQECKAFDKTSQKRIICLGFKQQWYKMAASSQDSNALELNEFIYFILMYMRVFG